MALTTKSMSLTLTETQQRTSIACLLGMDYNNPHLAPLKCLVAVYVLPNGKKFNFEGVRGRECHPLPTPDRHV